MRKTDTLSDRRVCSSVHNRTGGTRHFLKRERKRTKTPCPDTSSPRDPLWAYKKTQLVAMLREERTRWQETEKQQIQLLQEDVQKNVKIVQLEAELSQYCSYLERLRISIQQQEHGN